ncbi:MAG: hypothetical protein A2W90_03985 [Bacteroidetes bacterium GWF2_42_66]|nr:MAG: hypothetical protein A2W92_07780 [Bacteroidetes bacterium GWA2_42_15]OFY02515.1 MAG: hypothetical protein A2W89_21870 [Bacteroidetes bacterium GWE2_42_39]OFY41387.1 MAG: hypothetical protein A2W90_03985 [Bacteroidetes bacterium GWF2_42_66]HBL75412.1 hypothetical protein [Prolixibacteraceae bacterium]HCR90976.1 hypothetical protein [Prolixibacteraceae bacterium]
MKQYWVHIIFLIVLVSACRRAGEPVPLVKVGDHTLYEHQVAELIPENLEGADSSLWADDYITKWIRKELLIMKAESNLSAEQKNLREELEEYRNSMIIFRYKNELVAQKMDTMVSQQEIMTYYEGHKDKFFLTQEIIKAIYIKIPLEVADPKMMKSLCVDENPGKLSELNDYCLSYAKQYDKFNDSWVPARLVLDHVPIKIDDTERFLRRNKFIESKDNDYFYLVCIRDFCFVGQPAPIDYVESQVKNLILNTRKIQFLKQTEDDVYKEGIDNHRVKIFNK